MVEQARVARGTVVRHTTADKDGALDGNVESVYKSQTIVISTNDIRCYARVNASDVQVLYIAKGTHALM